MKVASGGVEGEGGAEQLLWSRLVEENGVDCLVGADRSVRGVFSENGYM